MLSREQFEVNMQKARDAGWSEDRIQRAAQALQQQGVIENPGFLSNVVKGIAQPAVDYASLVGEAGIQAGRSISRALPFTELGRAKKAVESGTATDSQSRMLSKSYDPTLMTSPKQKYAYENAERLPEYGLRKGVGAASYFIPGGGGGAATAGGRIATAAGRGFLAGAARTAGEDFTTGNDILKGGAFGAGTGAALQGAGEAVRGVRNLARGAAGGIEKTGNTLSKSAQRKALNKVSLRKYGEGEFLDNLDDVGLGQFQGPEDLAESASSLIDDSQRQLEQGLSQLSGKKISRKAIIDMLDDEIAKRPAADARAPFEAVREKVIQDFGNKTSLDAADFIRLRRNYGGLGKWKLGGEIGPGQSGAYEKVYVEMNKQLDDLLKQSGFEQFRMFNKNITTGIDALDVADEALRKVRSEPLNLYDYIVGAGIAGQSPVAGVGGIAARQVLTSPKVMGAAGKGLQSAGRNLARPTATSAGIRMSDNVTPNLLKQSFRSGIPARLASQMGTQPSAPQSGGYTGGGAEYLQGLNIPAGTQQAPPSYYETYQRLSGQGGEKKVTEAQANAESGLRALQTLQGVLYNPQGGVSRGTQAAGLLPFQGFNSKAQIMETSSREIQDVLQRMRTGAAINEREYEFYNNQLPKLTDTPERIAYKMRLFGDLFARMSQ